MALCDCFHGPMYLVWGCHSIRETFQGFQTSDWLLHTLAFLWWERMWLNKSVACTLSIPAYFTISNEVIMHYMFCNGLIDRGDMQTAKYTVHSRSEYTLVQNSRMPALHTFLERCSAILPRQFSFICTILKVLCCSTFSLKYPKGVLLDSSQSTYLAIVFLLFFFFRRGIFLFCQVLETVSLEMGSSMFGVNLARTTPVNA